MINFPAIWWLFPCASIGLILFSILVTRFIKAKSPFLKNAFVILGSTLGFLSFLLPFFDQPNVQNLFVAYAIGLPLTLIGLIGRIYPMIYLRKQGTTTAMDEVGKLVDTGPYGWVRHPQYTFGFILLCGWFLVWGALYGLYLLPLIGGIIFCQALIEEKYILEKKFEQEYGAYRKRVGMLLPKIARRKGN